MKRRDFISIVLVTALCMLVGLVFMRQRTQQVANSRRLVCLNNLKQLGLATRIWARDSSDVFPMSYPVARGGSREWVAAGEIWRHYLSLSNALVRPQTLACPDDSRTAASSWNSLTNNRQISYIVGIDAQETRPNMLLSGDRNIALHGKHLAGVVSLGTNAPIHWTANDIHRGEGNIGYADGSVQQFTTAKLQAALAWSGDSTNRLVFP